MRLDPWSRLVMLSCVAAGDLPLTIARRILTVLIAAAMAFAPAGVAMGGAAMAAGAPAHATHAMHHDHGAMQPAASADQMPAGHCKGVTSSRTCCCDDKGACAQTCLQKCFGQMAVIAPDRSARAHAPLRFAALSAEPPPDWSSAPQPPPPRA